MSAGKGDKDSRTPDLDKRREGWDRIFGTKEKPKEKNIVKDKNGK